MIYYAFFMSICPGKGDALRRCTCTMLPLTYLSYLKSVLISSKKKYFVPRKTFSSRASSESYECTVKAVVSNTFRVLLCMKVVPKGIN